VFNTKYNDEIASKEDNENNDEIASKEDDEK
jgi:hypothetical protein